MDLLVQARLFWQEPLLKYWDLSRYAAYTNLRVSEVVKLYPHVGN